MAVKVEEQDENSKGKKTEETKKETVENQTESPNQEMMKQLEEMRKELKELREAKATPVDSGSQQAEIFAELLKKVKGVGEDKTAVASFQGYTTFDDIDAEDMLKPSEYVTFMSPRSGYVIVDTIINNKPVIVPYKPIVFKFDNSTRIQTGKDVNIFMTSKYVCKSKKELAFLKSHHLRNVMFFDNTKGEQSVNGNIAMKMAGVMNALKSVQAHDLFNMCRAEGIEPSTDVSLMRQSIALKRATEMHEAEKTALNNQARMSLIEKDLVNK